MTASTPPFPKSAPTPLFTAFSREVERIRGRWLTCDRLFFDADAPHDTGAFQEWPLVWQHIYNALIADVILSLCRLVDRPMMKGRSNLTIHQVWDEMGTFAGRDNLRRATKAAKQMFVGTVEKAELVRFRHRLLGHNDLMVLLGQEDHSAEIQYIHNAVQWLLLFQWRCESLYEGRLVDYSSGPSAVHRDHAADRRIRKEVDALVSRLRSRG